MRRIAVILALSTAGFVFSPGAGTDAGAQELGGVPFYTAALTPFEAQVGTSANGSITRVKMAGEEQIGMASAPSSLPLSIPVEGLGPPPTGAALKGKMIPPAPSVLDRPGVTFISPLPG